MFSLLFTLLPPCSSWYEKVLIAGFVVGKIADEHLQRQMTRDLVRYLCLITELALFNPP